ncbi:MAG: DNA-deoxyinosine glycosylase [Bacilli bacterium]
MEYRHITHESIKPFYGKESRILILGSFPSIGSRKEGFYYAYPTNRFFKILASLFLENEPVGTEKRKEFLKRHHIALFDVIWECDIQASSDSSIKNVVVNDFSEIISQSQIRAVFTTGTKSTQLYRKYVSSDNIYLPSPSAANATTSLESLTEAYKIILSYL